MYIVEKDGVYLHGVFWIGEDFEEAKRKADTYAAHDEDNFHSWCVRKYREIDASYADGTASHRTVYVTRKVCK